MGARAAAGATATPRNKLVSTIWRIREALQVLGANGVRESLDCIGLYTNLGGVGCSRG
jgi:hypothetical protein